MCTWDETAATIVHVGRPSHKCHMVEDGLSEMMIRSNWKGYKSSSESLLVRTSTDEWLY